MALFTINSPEVTEGYDRCSRESSEGSEASVVETEQFNDRSRDRYSGDGSSGSDAQHEDESEHQQTSVGFFGGFFRSRNVPADDSSPNLGAAKARTHGDEGDISQYWQNYDLSVSEAPKLFSDAEFEAVKRIQHGLEVLILRKRLQDRIAARNREREVRAAVRVQALSRGLATRASLPAMREQHCLRVRLKREYKMFKRELRSDGFLVYLYRNKDGALHKVTLRPNGKLNSLCWSMGVAKVKSGSVPLIALKSCYTGYPKRGFPTKSMQARATPLPDKTKTFTIQVDNGKVYVFVTAEEIHGPPQKKLVKGLQSIIDEISSPDSFYFDGTGVLRRVTSSIFDDRGNIAQREAAKKKRQERFRFRKGEAEARRAALRLKGALEEDSEERASTSSHLVRQGIIQSTRAEHPPPSPCCEESASLRDLVSRNEGRSLADGEACPHGFSGADKQRSAHAQRDATGSS